MMRTVVITAPERVRGEEEVIRRLLDGGVWRLHLRRPGASEAEVRRFVESLPEVFYPRLSLHDHAPLAVEYGLGGVHLNSRNRTLPDGFRGVVSRSCHTLAEVMAAKDEDYLFLSPIYDSISKSGYGRAFGRVELVQAAAEGIINERVFALGGVRKESLSELRDLGFGGAAMLGDVWRDTSAAAIDNLIRKINDL